MSNDRDDGATKVPEAEAPKGECPGDGSGRRFRHTWHWVWEGTTWTNDVRCGTCGQVEQRVRREA